MTEKEYLEQIEKKAVDDSKVQKVEAVYGDVLPELIRIIISNNNEPEFFDNGVRILAYNEIIDAEKDLHVDFKKKGIIPVADCGENNFVVYHFAEKIWSKFNIIDETVFKKKDCLEVLLK